MSSQTPELEHDFRDLFVDPNLFSIFKSAPSVFATRSNAVITILTVIIVGAFCVWRYEHIGSRPHPDFVQTFSSWATVGWGLSSTLLGFLIAGFALLCTALSPSAVVSLHKYKPNPKKPNQLRELFLFFVDIFINYLCLLLFSLSMAVVTSANGMYHEIAGLLRLIGPNVPTLVAYVFYVFWATWFVVSILKLKSFVYNLYQALLYGMTERVHNEMNQAQNIAVEIARLLSRL